MTFKSVNLFLALLVTLIFSQTGTAEEIRVGLEPLPPLIIDKNTGYTVDMLKTIEKNTDLTFNIRIMPYNRVKHALKSGDIDLGGHTPYKMETPEFYTYAVDVEWFVTTLIDIYAKSAGDVASDTYKVSKRIGTPRGNEGFMSELFGIPATHFMVNELDNIVKMLNAGRLEFILFERSATMSTIQKLKLPGIHYKMIDDSIKAGFAVNKNPRGQQVKKLLEDAIRNTDQDSLFKDFFKYTRLPEQGVVPN
ncbi:MAG TPA: hypothetical protein DHV36_24440 [Desulfobacteraceae bacterium]|nr:hypothetical protein [Desulfobacteraceae bacterium]